MGYYSTGLHEMFLRQHTELCTHVHVHTLTGENTGNWGKFVSMRANGYSSFRVKHLLHQALHLKESDKEK